MVALLLSGCAYVDNWYESDYKSTKESLGELAYFLPNTPVKKKDVEVRPVTRWDHWDHDIDKAMGEGYIPIGNCRQGAYDYYTPDNFCTPWALAVDQAANVGADLVLIGNKETRTEKKRIVTNTFGISTGNSYSYAMGNSYGVGTRGPYGFTTGNSYGSTTGWNNSSNFYSGTTTSHEQHLWLFEKSAIFFRKGNFDSISYGAYVAPPPPLLPDETENSPVTCYILFVLKGSQAERDGLRSGQRVAKINGKPIRTRKDLRGISLRSISSVEVAK